MSMTPVNPFGGMSPGIAAVRRGAPEVGGRRLSRELLARVWRQFVQPYRRRLALFLVAILVSAGLAVIPPVLFGMLIDHAVLDGDLGRVNVLALAAVAVAITAALFSLLQRYLSAWLGERIILDLRRTLYDHVQRMPLAFFTRTQTGALISRMNNDVIGAQQAVTGTFGSVVANVVQLLAALAVMVRLEWRLTLLVLAVLPLFVAPARRVGRKLQDITREQMVVNAQMNSRMTERFNVAGALLVKLFGRYREEAEEFGSRAQRVAEIGVRGAVLGRIFFVTLALVGAVGTAVVYWLGGRMAITSPDFSPGNIVTFAALVTQAYTPLSALTNARVEIMTAFVSFERVFEVLDVRHPIADRDDAVELADPAGEVVFDDVTFAYPSAAESSLLSLEDSGAPLDERPGELVLHGVSFTARPGKTVALVGPSGAGKSTICSLIPRLYDVTTGAVRVDGLDVRDLMGDSLRAAIGVVPQDPHLFHETVAANLRYARPDATPDDLEAACRAAQIHDVIAALPDRYDTLVGERGYRLSGGEKQRLAIARLLLKDPAIVILDEATAHLDSENEALVQEALRTALAGRTSIVIAHRLSTIVAADQILVVQAGRVVQRGRHEELFRAEGLYAELARTQFARSG
ncbi:MAG TPA: ABC transporter ATP-binding protein [Egibacteraceae bacterium]|nr:ABC transporter ATP-binding protein [Egibacteraceae bacterium]